MATAILGDKELQRKLDRLASKSSRKAIRAGINAGMTPIVKALRSAINATSASPALKRAARKTIGKRFRKARGGINSGQMEAKVGFAVGKKKGKAADRGGKDGVGVSSANIHWFVLGTEERHKKTTGQATGEIPELFAGVTAKAFSSSQSASLEAARKKITQVILKEAVRK